MSIPLLYNFLLTNLPVAPKVSLRADAKANTLVIDGSSLVSILYPCSLDSVLPPWKELYNRVRLFVQRFTDVGFKLVVFFSGMCTVFTLQAFSCVRIFAECFFFFYPATRDLVFIHSFVLEPGVGLLVAVVKSEQQNVEGKKRLVLERGELVSHVLCDIESGARLPDVCVAERTLRVTATAPWLSVKTVFPWRRTGFVFHAAAADQGEYLEGFPVL